MAKHILIIEDNTDLSHLLKINLSDLGFQIDLAADGTQGFSMACESQYDLVILDIMLPGMDGMQICKQLRAKQNFVPILMLTARSSEVDRVLGLEIGADDYVTKPFSIMELIAKVKAIFRRIELTAQKTDTLPEKAADHIVIGKLCIDLEKRKVTLGGKNVELTAREFELLLFFASHPGRVYNRSQLLETVWGYAYSGYEHTVNSHINRLRAKIEADPSQPDYIKTVWGVGYRFADYDEFNKGDF